MDRWVGKVAVVTGASAGIGAASVVALAKQGMTVVGLARRPERVEILSQQVEKGGGKIYALECNICIESDIEAAFLWIKQNLGGVDVLINNAGTIRQGTLVDVGTKDGPISGAMLREVLETNVLGLVMCSQRATLSMRDRQVPGHIVHINSITGQYLPELNPGVPLTNIYPPSKFAVTAIAAQMRKEFARSETNINVTSISPGVVETDLFSEGRMDLFEEVIMKEKKKNLLKPVDVADAIVYVLSLPQRITVQELTIRPSGEKF